MRVISYHSGPVDAPEVKYSTTAEGTISWTVTFGHELTIYMGNGEFEDFVGLALKTLQKSKQEEL